VNRIAAKKFWLQVHVLIGMWLGLMFVFAGLTGSVLVFHRAIDGWLNPTMLTLAEPAEMRPLDELLASLKEATPDLPAPTYLDLPETQTDVVHAWYRLRTDPGQEPRKLEVLLHPGTGELLGRREYGADITSIIYGLHREWLSGNVGETAVGIVGITLVFSMGTGVHLWWPTRGQFHNAFRRPRTASRLQQHYYRHKMTGLSGAVVLVLVSCSGIFIEFHEWLTPAINLVSPVAEGEPSVFSRGGPVNTPISAQQAINLSRRRFPDAEVTFIMLPDGPAAVYAVGMRQPNEVLKTGGSSGVWIDQYSGELLAVRDWAEFTAGETFVAWMFPLHNGEAFGLPGRLLVFVSGFVPLILYVTALRMWWLKRKALHKQRSEAVTIPSK
jgi:uncharacterized iron-regulated membrane protein